MLTEAVVADDISDADNSNSGGGMPGMNPNMLLG